jgi:hypothetical protein
LILADYKVHNILAAKDTDISNRQKALNTTNADTSAAMSAMYTALISETESNGNNMQISTSEHE